MKTKLLAITILLTLPLAACSNDNNHPELTKDLDAFFAARNIENVDIPFLSLVDDNDVVYKYSLLDFDGDYAPFFTFAVKGNLEADYKSSLTNAKWTIKTETGVQGFFSFDPDLKLEIDVSYISEADYAETNLKAGTYAVVYSYDDLYGEVPPLPGEGLADEASEFLTARGISGVDVSFLNTISEDLIIYTDCLDDFDDEGNIPYFDICLDGDVESAMLTMFRNAGWTVPTFQTEYGYECLDPTGAVEADVIYYSYEECTYITFYSYVDIYGGGGGVIPEGDGDYITSEIIGAEGTTYVDWTLTGNTGAVYVGQSAASYDSVQLRSKNNNSGIVTTVSGGIGIIDSIAVEWNEHTSEDRALEIYASNTPFTSPEDLYASGATKVGEIKFGEASYTFTSEYAYVGVRSKSGALYLDSITFIWKDLIY